MSDQDPGQPAGEQVEIRLRGTPEICQASVRRLAEILEVTRTSRPYPDRDGFDQVRVYLPAIVPETEVSG
jgi:hypothetical protein